MDMLCEYKNMLCGYKDMLCGYKDMFGKPSEGAHKYKIGGIAVVDTIATVAGAALISKFFSLSFVWILIILLLLSLMAHLIFCVDTTVVKGVKKMFGYNTNDTDDTDKDIKTNDDTDKDIKTNDTNDTDDEKKQVVDNDSKKKQVVDNDSKKINKPYNAKKKSNEECNVKKYKITPY